jgi:putative membrane protein
MKIVSRIIAAILFIVFFGFALKNTQEAALRFFFGYEITAPLVLLLLGFFAGGAVLGVLAMTPIVFRHKRDLSKHKKTIESMRKEGEAQELARMQPPPPDSVLNK